MGQAVFGQSADLEILDQDVAFRDQAAGKGLAVGRGDIQGERALVAVGAGKIGALACLLALGIGQLANIHASFSTWSCM